MHYGILVVTEEKPTEETIAKLLAPYENIEWDWFQIGGRWTGTLDGYDPETDPANIVECDLCNGSGKRKDMDCSLYGGCNGCKGEGKRVKWPTGWKPHNGDTVPIAELTQEKVEKAIHAVVAEGYGWQGGEVYQPWSKEQSQKFVRMEMPPIGWLQETFPNGFATVVDIHN